MLKQKYPSVAFMSASAWWEMLLWLLFGCIFGEVNGEVYEYHAIYMKYSFFNVWQAGYKLNYCPHLDLPFHLFLSSSFCCGAGDYKFSQSTAARSAASEAIASSFRSFRASRLLCLVIVPRPPRGGGSSQIMLVYGYVPRFWGAFSPF